MPTPSRIEPGEIEVDARQEQLTPLERAIDKAEINAAACIQAIGNSVFKICMGIALVAFAITGDVVEIPESVVTALATNIR